MLAKIRNQIRFYLTRRRWRKLNSNNDTYMGNYFDPEVVSVGIKSYGLLNIINHNKNSKLRIGNYCSIAPEVVFILNGEHNLGTISTFPFKTHSLKTERFEAGTNGDIQIDDDVWIGYGATIMSGIHIGQGAVIAARAVVTKDVEPYEIVGGVPAKKIGMRFNSSMVEEAKLIDYSKLTLQMIEAHSNELYMDLIDVGQLDWLPKRGRGD